LALISFTLGGLKMGTNKQIGKTTGWFYPPPPLLVSAAKAGNNLNK
jgi:hypothetical protein